MYQCPPLLASNNFVVSLLNPLHSSISLSHIHISIKKTISKYLNPAKLIQFCIAFICVISFILTEVLLPIEIYYFAFMCQFLIYKIIFGGNFERCLVSDHYQYSSTYLLRKDNVFFVSHQIRLYSQYSFVHLQIWVK